MLVYLAFFLSGFAALLYQVVWERLLALFSGSDVRSAALVVAAFLAGLGLGSLGGSRLADRLSAAGAVRLYAAGNVLIGLYALASRTVFYDLLFLRLSTLAGSRALAFSLAFAALLPPTLAMGLSLPLLARGLVRSLPGAPQTLARLYGLDILGAAGGAFLTGWLLLGSLGLEATLRFGAGLSLLAAALAFAGSTGMPREREAATPAGPAAGGRIGSWAVLFFLSGFLAVGLEVVWFRHFGVATQSSAYTFGHVLGVFLLFDALGTLLGGRIALRTADARGLFLLVQALIVLLATAGLWLASRPFFVPLNQWAPDDRSLVTLTTAFGLLPLLLIAPGAFAIGLGFPLVQKAVQDDLGRVGERVGLLQLANIAGNTAGGLATGMVLLDRLGTPATLRLLGLLGLVLLAGRLRRRPHPPERADAATAGVVGVALLALIATFPRGTDFWPAIQGLVTTRGDTVLVAEDASGVSVLHDRRGLATLYIQGQPQGLVPPWRIHVLLGVAGPLLHPAPRDILIVGVGSGGTPYFAGLVPGAERVRAVEIVGSALAVLRAHTETTGGDGLGALFRDPRYRLVVDDARRDLAVGGRLFDVIEADAVPPWSSRSGMLYSQEFFRQVLAHLHPGGLMVQWRATARVEATFRSVFPHGVRAGPILIGSDRPVPFAPERTLERLGDPALVDALARTRVSRDVVAATLAPPAWSRWDRATLPDPAELNTDLFPRDEYYLNQPQRP